VGNRSLFQKNVTQHKQKWDDLVSTSATKELDTAITTIWNDLEGINKVCFPPFSPKFKYVPWWTPQLNTLRKQVNALKRRAKRCKNPVLKDLCSNRYKEHKNIYKTEILKAKQDSWKEFCTKNARSSPWKVYKMSKADFTRQTFPSSLTLPPGSVTTSAKETANALLHKFLPDYHIAHDSAQQKNIRTKVAGSETPAAQTALNFRDYEVTEVIEKSQDKKCPGPDGIYGTIAKGLHKILPTLWSTLFNTCFKLGCFPKVWKRARVIPIPKTDKRKLHTVQGYRGISLPSIPGKCLEKLVIGRLNNFLESTEQIPPQYGFTAGRSTADAIKTVTESARRGRKIGLKCVLLALDIEGAFDNAWHPGMLARLWEIKCSKKSTVW
jgi:hypothetical protein